MKTGLIVTFKDTTVELIDNFLLKTDLFGYHIDNNSYQFDCNENDYDSFENELIYELDRLGMKNYYIEGIFN